MLYVVYHGKSSVEEGSGWQKERNYAFNSHERGRTDKRYIPECLASRLCLLDWCPGAREALQGCEYADRPGSSAVTDRRGLDQIDEFIVGSWNGASVVRNHSCEAVALARGKTGRDRGSVLRDGKEGTSLPEVANGERQ